MSQFLSNLRWKYLIFSSDTEIFENNTPNVLMLVQMIKKILNTSQFWNYFQIILCQSVVWCFQVLLINVGWICWLCAPVQLEFLSCLKTKTTTVIFDICFFSQKSALVADALSQTWNKLAIESTDLLLLPCHPKHWVFLADCQCWSLTITPY